MRYIYIERESTRGGKRDGETKRERVYRKGRQRERA